MDQSCDAVGNHLRRIGDRHRLGVLAIAIAHFNGAIVHGVAAGDGDQRYADQLGILELHTRRDLLTVIENDLDALGLKFGNQLFRGFKSFYFERGDFPF